VTLYGVADVNVEYVNHVGVVPQASNGFSSGKPQKVIRENSGGYSASRWGIRGTEVLGGGMKSVFVLENGFNADTGTLQQGGRFFQALWSPAATILSGDSSRSETLRWHGAAVWSTPAKSVIFRRLMATAPGRRPGTWSRSCEQRASALA
jgi:hypothetical protein